MKTRIVAFILALLLVGCTSAPTPLPTPTAASTPVPAILYVDPARDLGPLSPYVFGSNYGPMHAVPLDVMPLAVESGITALRFPGGAWGDNADIIPSQIDMFMDFCAQMGAIPTISVRLLGGTPEAAAELVHYTNVEKDYGVVYWSIGNEPNLYQEQTGEAYDTVRFNEEWRAIAEAMLAVDPDIQLMGPELSQWGTSLASTPKDPAGRDWMTEFLRVNGDLVDVVAVHRYPLWRPAGVLVTIPEMRANVAEWTGLVTYLRQLVQDETGRDLPLAFTEVNSSPTATMLGEASPDSFYNAIWYAEVLGQLADQGVLMVNQWVLSQRAGGLGLFYGSQVRPTYYTFHMYARYGSERIYAASGVDEVTVHAARRDDGALTIMVINLSDTERSVTLRVEGESPVEAEVWRLDATHKAESLGTQPWPAGGTLDLPARSVTLYILVP